MKHDIIPCENTDMSEPVRGYCEWRADFCDGSVHLTVGRDLVLHLQSVNINSITRNTI